VAERILLVGRANNLADIRAYHIEAGGPRDAAEYSLRLFEEARLAFADHGWRFHATAVEAELAAIGRDASGKPPAGLIVADLGDIVACGALGGLALEISRLARERQLEASVVLLQPPDDSASAVLAAAYAAFAELAALRARGDGELGGIWLALSDDEGFRVSQWLLNRLQSAPEHQDLAGPPALGVFGAWAATGAPERATILLADILGVVAEELRKTDLRPPLKPHVLKALYLKAAAVSPSDNFQLAERLRSTIKADLNNGLARPDFWDRIERTWSELSRQSPIADSMEDQAFLGETQDAPPPPGLAALLDLAARRQRQLGDDMAGVEQRLEQLRSFEQNEAYASRALGRAGRGAAADLVVGAVMERFDERVYARIRERLRWLLALAKVRRYAEGLVAALDGRTPPRRTTGSPFGPSLEFEQGADLQPGVDELLLWIERAQSGVASPDESAWPAGLDFARSNAVAVAQGAGWERRLLYAPADEHPALAAKAAGLRAELTPLRFNGSVDLVVERTGFDGESVPALARQRKALFELLKAQPGTAALLGAEAPFASSLVTPFSGPERRRRADALLEFARALVLGLAPQTEAGEICLHADQAGLSNLVRCKSAVLAFDLLCEDEDLLANLRDEVSALRRRSGDAELEIKLALLLGKLAEALFDRVDASLGSPLAGEWRAGAAREPEIAARLERTYEAWSMSSRGSPVLRVLRRRS
jgi:hypothetical protein